MPLTIRTHLTIFSKMRKSCFPREGSGGGETCLGSLNVSPFDPVKTFPDEASPGFFGPGPGWGWEDATTGAGSLGCLLDLGTAGHLKPPKDARLGRACGAGPSPSGLPPRGPSRPAAAAGIRTGKAGGGGGRGGGMGERAPKLQTAQLQLQVSGPSLEAIINLRFIFIGELESRLTLAKQGSSSRPLDALECRGIFLQEGSAGAPALNLFLRLHLLTD